MFYSEACRALGFKVYGHAFGDGVSFQPRQMTRACSNRHSEDELSFDLKLL